MRVILNDSHLIVVAEDDAERERFAVWRAGRQGHVFFFDGGSAKGGAMHDLGPEEDACREPINIVFDQVEARWQPISNLASTPFRLAGRTYVSVEGFWQGLRFALDADRVRVAALWGKAAKRAAEREPERETFVYDGQSYARGGPGHRGLMLQAVRAKFSQHRGAREALLATGERPLEHRTRRDSETIPGALMADMWMRLRKALRSGRLPEGLDGGEAQTPSAEPDGRIRYFARDRQAFGFLSHFHPAPTDIDGEHWPTVEHYFQAQKSFHPAYRAAIRAAETPAAAKQLAADPDPDRPAAQKSWFLKTGQTMRPDWDDVKLDIMRRADLAKFMQHPDLARQLLATGTVELIEDSPFEPFWGIGQDGAGLNWAGRVLMEVRAHLTMLRSA